MTFDYAKLELWFAGHVSMLVYPMFHNVGLLIRVGQKYKKSYSILSQMFFSVKFRAEQFSFSKLFDSRPSSFPKLHFYFYKGIHAKIQREILEF